MRLYASARIVGQVRQRAGLSQAELAQRSGISQSVISAYENGRREPGLAALVRIAGAAGLRLDVIDAPAAAREPAGPSSSPCLSSIQLQRNAEALSDVLDLADRLPAAHHDELSYPWLPARQGAERR